MGSILSTEIPYAHLSKDWYFTNRGIQPAEYVPVSAELQFKLVEADKIPPLAISGDLPAIIVNPRHSPIFKKHPWKN